jgi:serine/threonine protein kinase
VREIGEAPEGSAYIAMELLDGDDLASLLRGSATLPLEHCVDLVRDVARGLEALHAANVVHRDLKPQNLFRCRGTKPSWKILDYGVSKLVDGTATLTEGNLVGTPAYMSPEQAQGRAVDPRSDVFALACVAYRVLTGRRPFAGADTPQLLYQVVYNAPIRPRELSSAIPRDVELVLAIAFAKRPEDRFRSAASFAVAFEAAARGELDAALRDKAEKLLVALPWARDPMNALSRTAIAVPLPRT